MNLALCGLETTQNQVKDQSKQIERLTSISNDQSQQLNGQSQQIEILMAKNTEQSQQITSLTSIVRDLVQQLERLTGQAVLVDKTTNQTNDETNKIGATSVKVKEGKFL